MRVLATLLLTAALLGSSVHGGWLETFTEQLCGTDIRCYTNSYTCAERLNVYNLQAALLGYLRYCRFYLGSNSLRQDQLTIEDLFDVMNNVHGDQLPQCILVQMGVLVNDEVNRAGLYLLLARTIVSLDPVKQNNFLDSTGNCSAPNRVQLPAFVACVMQSCTESL